MELKSYLGDKKLKTKFVAEIKKHLKADAVEQGHYGKENGHWKGCAVACSVRSMCAIKGEKLQTINGDHKRYEIDLGIPEWLARLEDTIFEGLPVEESKKWVLDFAQAVPIGKNLESIKWKFCAFILKENINRVLTLEIDDDLKKQVVDAIRGVLNVHEEAIKEGVWNESAAESAAYIKYAKELLKLLKNCK